MISKKINFRKFMLMAVISILMISLTACGGTKKIDVSENISVTFEGCDGYATANLSVDYEGINAYIEDYDKFAKKLEKLNEDNEVWVAMCSNTPLADLITFSIDNYENLSNGDVVQVNLEINPLIGEITDFASLQETVGIEFTKTVFEFTVEGLEEAKVIDIVGIVKNSVIFDGANGGATARFNLPDDYAEEIEGFYFKREFYADVLKVSKDNKSIGELIFVFSEKTGLSNGDVIEVTIRDNSESERIIAEFMNEGYIIPTNATLEVSGLGEYISSPDQLTSEMKEEINNLIDKIVDESNKTIKEFNITNYYWGTLNPDVVVNNPAAEKCGLFITYKYESWVTAYGCFAPKIIVYPDGSYSIDMDTYLSNSWSMENAINPNYSYETIEF